MELNGARKRNGICEVASIEITLEAADREYEFG
jgi:hypothetical protein